jgi:hypothetical protein
LATSIRAPAAIMTTGPLGMGGRVHTLRELYPTQRRARAPAASGLSQERRLFHDQFLSKLLHANRTGKRISDVRDEGPQSASERSSFPAETANGPLHPPQTAENRGCSAETGNAGLAQDCVVEPGGLEPATRSLSAPAGKFRIRRARTHRTWSQKGLAFCELEDEIARLRDLNLPTLRARWWDVRQPSAHLSGGDPEAEMRKPPEDGFPNVTIFSSI